MTKLKPIYVRCHDCKRQIDVNADYAIEVHCTADGTSTYSCRSCLENPDWRDCDPHAK